MPTHTRRRAVALLIAGAASVKLTGLIGRADAAKTPQCLASQPFKPWVGIATQQQVGAKIVEVPFLAPETCDLNAELQVSDNFEAKLVIYGDPDKTPLPKEFLIKADNRLIVRNADGKVVIDEPLCGVCTEIHDDRVDIVLPLALSPLLRSERVLELAVKLGDKEECKTKLDCELLRKALDWAATRQEVLAQQFEAKQCTPPKNCFITTACCETIGLGDDCFELRTLRHYRDTVLVKTANGAADIATYYALAPKLLAAMPACQRETRLLSLYLRYILPCALAATLRFNRLTYRLYRQMMRELADDLATELAL